MDLLIAVKSCQAHRSYHQAIRDTWGRYFPQVIFFMGDGHGHEVEDEVSLNCPDDYMSLPTKTKHILSWSLTYRDFAHVYLCDNDTFVQPSRFANLEYQNYDYSGYMNKLCPVGETAFYKDHIGVWPNCHPWTSGGVGYFLSSRAATAVSEQTPDVWAEDLWVGQVIGPEIQAGRFTGSHLENFHEVAAWHMRRTKKYPQYKPEMMYRSWQLGNPDLMYAEDRA